MDEPGPSVASVPRPSLPSPLPSSSLVSSPTRLAAFPSRSSSSSGHSSPVCRPLQTAEELQAALPTVVRYAFADLIVSVLRLDFWDDSDPNSLLFCKITFDLAVQHLGMPDKTARSLKAKLEGTEFNDDIATLITSIRSDSVVGAEGAELLLGSLLLAFVSSGNYDSRFRVLLRHLATLLAVVWEEFEEIEDTLTDVLMSGEYVETEGSTFDEQSKRTREKNSRNKKIKRYLMIGAAGGLGGVLIGLTGGLAAPLIAGGASVFIGSAAAAGIGTAAGAAVLGTGFGVAGAGLTGYKMKKRVGAIEEFQVETLTEGTSLRCILCVSGWIDKDTDPEYAFKQQWRHLKMAHEQYTLHYESKYLAELGSAIDYLMSFAVSMAIQQTLMETALHALVAAVAWPVALLGAASVLDNPWNVCIARATEVGEHLAEVLLARAHGKRPITLIGFSLGARVIFHCLLSLSKRPEGTGLIEDVLLLGAPVTASPKQWALLSRVVGGRIINGYCHTDWLLRFVYRTMSVQATIAGTSPVEDRKKKKIVNYNLSHIVKGHMDYSRKLTEVLEAVGLKVSPHSEDSLVDLHAVDALTLSEKEASRHNLEMVKERDEGITFDVGEVRVKDKDPSRTAFP